jgi:hypothetical protein
MTKLTYDYIEESKKYNAIEDIVKENNIQLFKKEYNKKIIAGKDSVKYLEEVSKRALLSENIIFFEMIESQISLSDKKIRSLGLIQILLIEVMLKKKYNIYKYLKTKYLKELSFEIWSFEYMKKAYFDHSYSYNFLKKDKIVSEIILDLFDYEGGKQALKNESMTIYKKIEKIKLQKKIASF